MKGLRDMATAAKVWAFNGTTEMDDTPRIKASRGETADIAFVADNPGDWRLHCHMLEQSADTMMTWLRVA